MNTILRLLRPPFPRYGLIMVRYRGRQSNRSMEELVAREADAFSLLSQAKRVRVRIEENQSELRRLTGAKLTDTVVELDSTELKKIIKELKSSISVVDGDGSIPLFKFDDEHSHSSSHGDKKTGINLAQGERGKTLRMNSQIDDHMLGVRVKQAQAFLDSGYVVTLFIKLPRKKLAGRDVDAEEKKEQERQDKIMYNIEAQRFLTAFSEIPSVTLRLLERPQLTEIAILVKRSKQS